MITNVIILAQGQQKRLPNLPVAKQMIRLPDCGETPILCRTLRQLWNILPGDRYGVGPSGFGRGVAPHRVTVVTWPPLMETLLRIGAIVRMNPADRGGTVVFYPNVDTLPDPGNSSLRGAARYLRGPLYRDEHDRRTRHGEPSIERTVILLGDVVYSWACLRAIIEGTHWHMGFVGTSTLSTSDGELWGLSWERTAEETMLSCLDAALEKHPKFTEYQPGQMRRWLWETDDLIDGTRNNWRAGQSASNSSRTWYRAIDDYTRDIDLPEHVDGIGKLSELAAADDRENGVTWP